MPKALALFLILPFAAAFANPDFNGRWRLLTDRSSALDGWTAMDLKLQVDGSKVAITHDMRWRSTRVVETNTVDTAEPGELDGFFRVEQRHMAVYPKKGATYQVSGQWLDDGQALRVEAVAPVETSQGDTSIRIYSEYRIGVGGDSLTVIELRSSRNNPLVYRFKRLPADDTSRP